MIRVLRARTNPQGELYLIDKHDGRTEAEATGQAVRWWAQGETVAVVTVAPGRPPSLFARANFLRSRVPADAGWPEDESKAAPKESETAPLFEEVTAEKPAAAAIGIALCQCCQLPRPAAADPEDRDRSPSGRMEDQRCPECGQRLRLRSEQIYRLYMTFQRQLSTEHDAKPKPWNQ